MLLHESVTTTGGQPSSELTRRQMEVLELLAEGLTNREIADRLYISVGTVKNHVHAILCALNVESRLEAAHLLSLTQRSGEALRAGR